MGKKVEPEDEDEDEDEETLLFVPETSRTSEWLVLPSSFSSRALKLTLFSTVSFSSRVFIAELTSRRLSRRQTFHHQVRNPCRYSTTRVGGR